MRVLWLFVMTVAVGASCADSTLDPCERAASHAWDCDARDAFRWNNNNECKEPDLCLANCIIATTCLGLRNEDPAQQEKLTMCLDACPGGSDI